jgi:DNA-binding NtrC family response regulator
MATILCIDDEPSILQLERRTLKLAGHRAIAVTDVDAAFAVLRHEDVDLILADYRLPGASGLEFLHQLRAAGSLIPLVMLTGYGSVEYAVEAMKAGAVDFVEKPIGPEQLRLVVNQALQWAELRRDTAALQQRVARPQDCQDIVGASPALQQALERARLGAPTRASILLHGESGTGKELIARMVHRESGRHNGPFVSINCAALPESLVEATLFGHERGAFTGAIRQTKGAFERADGGTLLLDEISDMRLDLQAKLLRALQEQEFDRVGGTEPVRVDVRVIVTTNKDLLAEIREGRFREDLYYRLSVLPIRVPPLRERLQDLPALIDHFMARVAEECGRPIARLSPEALEVLLSHAWPGNVRELSHAIERAVILSPTGEIGAEAIDLPSREIAQRPRGENATAGKSGASLPNLNIADAEQALIERALVATNRNRTRAASLLGISVRTLRNKLNRPDEARPG